jgi:hypothetical protein
MLTSSMLEALKAISDSPWDEHDGLTPRKLARMLHPFGVDPRQIHTSTLAGKGYRREELDRAFSSYLPSLPEKSETCETTRVNIEDNHDFQSET